MSDVVLFDNDGVLVDSLAATDRAWHQWAVEYDLDPAHVLGQIHGRPAHMSMEALLPEHLRAQGLDRIVRLELEDEGGVHPIPGAVDLLSAIPTGSAAIVTSATGELARKRLHLAGIPVPPVLVTAEDVERGKPEPDAWLAAARLLGVDTSTVTVLEDSRNGVVAARAAGVARVIGVGSDAEAYDVDLVVDDLRSCHWVAGRLVVD